MMTTTIQDRYSPLLGDPAALRTAWADLLQQHHHLHGPDAARRLGVPEAGDAPAPAAGEHGMDHGG